VSKRPSPEEIAAQLERAKPTSAAEKKSREGQASIMFWGDPAVRRQLKMISAETGKTQQRLLSEAMNLLFREYRKPEIA
jgi:hypothetical protein